MPTVINTGTTANDTLTGTAGADTLTGGGGNDLYLVNHLGDMVVEYFADHENQGIGTGGIDTVRTSVLNALKTFTIENWYAVENLEYSGTLAAQLKGNSSDNVIKANSATSTNDTLYGGAGYDTLYGYGGNDSLIGGSGNDYLDGGAGTDTMIGGVGNDTYVASSNGDVVLETVNGGFDTLRTAVTMGRDLRVGWAVNLEGLVYTGSTVASLYGNQKDNYVVSLSGTNETIYGYAGDDTLGGGAGADSMIGGIGNDIYLVDTSDIVVENVGEGLDTFWGTKTDISVSPYADRIENLVYTGTTSALLKGNGMDNFIGGGAGNETINGFDGNDWLYGGAGVDSILGGNGNDWLNGGGRSDQIVPEFGFEYESDFEPDFYSSYADGVADTLAGGAGDDRYQIDESLDTIVEVSTGGGFDTVISTIDLSLNDSRYANVESLVLDDVYPDVDPWFAEGNSMGNVLVGNISENYLSGGGGDDTLDGSLYEYSYSSGVDVLDGGDGNDVLIASRSAYYSNSVASVLLGGAGNDTYVVGNFDVAVHDTSGVDTVLLMTSADFTGSAGIDTIALLGSGQTALETTATNAINRIYQVGGLSALDVISSPGSALNVVGTDDNNRIIGNDYDNQLDGGAGNDSIIGNAGDDTLIGGAGIDSLVGGAGDDTYVIEAGDVIVEAANSGIDVIRSAVLTSYAGYANIEGLEYTGTANVTLQNAVNNTTADRFSGGFGNDTLRGYGGNDTLGGGAGNDTISGGDGADSISGDAGNDTLSGHAGDDWIAGGAGADVLAGGDGDDTFYGYSSHFSNGNHYSSGENDAGNSISGGGGDDDINGADGNDTLAGGTGADALYGYEGNDSITGDDGQDTIYGGAGNDTINGGAGNDSLVGGAGNDVIYAGAADINTNVFSLYGDSLSGGETYSSTVSGSDIFRFESTAAFASIEAYSGGPRYFGTGHVIKDFGVGDTIQFARSMVGDGDALIENAVTVATAGGAFSSAAELVIFGADLATDRSFDYTYNSGIAASEITAVIGNASSAYAVGDKRLFVVDDGDDSMMFQFTSSGADAVVSVNELKLIGVVANDGSMTASDFGLY